jgi:predicted metal-binding protein
MNEELIRLALENGAAKAEIISMDWIVTSAEFREACRQNICGLWGRCWMCPPDVGEIEPLMAELRTYQHALWYQTIGELEDSFDFEGMTETKKQHLRISQKIEEKVKPVLGRHLHLSCGGCGLCERCSRLDDQPCRFPDKAMTSLEAYGVDVYQTTKTTGLKYINGQNTVTYFSAVLF